MSSVLLTDILLCAPSLIRPQSLPPSCIKFTYVMTARDHTRGSETALPLEICSKSCSASLRAKQEMSV